jgi:PKD repeat protein
MIWIEVVADALPVADAGPDMSVDQDVPATFDGSGSSDDVGIDNYTWTIVELSVDMYGESPEYTFEEPGIYTVELVVTDTIGQVSTPDSMILTVNDTTDPVADAGADQSIMLGDEVTFDGSDSSDNVGVVLWEWTIDLGGGDTEVLTGETVDYEFTAAGEFEVTLRVEDAAGNEAEDTLTVTVTDDEDPVADAGSDPTGVVAGDTVTLDGSDSSDNSGVIASYVWTFVDGTDQELEGMTVEYTFENEGEFEVTLTVTDPSGNEDTDTVVVRVGSANEAPVAVIEGSPVIIVEAGDTVELDGTGSTDDNDAIESYTWTIELDGELLATLTGAQVEYEFDEAGTYVVTLNVTDEGGLWDHATLSVVVEEKSSILSDYWWLLATLAAVIVIGALVALLKPGKGAASKGKPSPPEEEEEFDEDELPPPDDEDI